MIEAVGAVGYLAVFAGALLEGELILLAAGVAAHEGLLDLPLVIGIGAFGAALGDHTWFLLGRWKGRALRARFPALAARDERVRATLHRHSAVTILLVRFLYGFRTAGAVLMGTTEMRVVKFSALDLVGAAAWAALVAGGGYSLGSAGENVLADLRQGEAVLAATLALAAASYWLRRRTARDADTTVSELPQHADVTGDSGSSTLGRGERGTVGCSHGLVDETARVAAIGQIGDLREET
jgi:membrane protein DedA with SNARE-associated domain